MPARAPSTSRYDDACNRHRALLEAATKVTDCSDDPGACTLGSSLHGWSRLLRRSGRSVWCDAPDDVGQIIGNDQRTTRIDRDTDRPAAGLAIFAMEA